MYVLLHAFSGVPTLVHGAWVAIFIWWAIDDSFRTLASMRVSTSKIEWTTPSPRSLVSCSLNFWEVWTTTFEVQKLRISCGNGRLQFNLSTTTIINNRGYVWLGTPVFAILHPLLIRHTILLVSWILLKEHQMMSMPVWVRMIWTTKLHPDAGGGHRNVSPHG